MTWLPVVAVGILQGLTEFLPVSSSGHMTIVLHWFPELQESALPLEVVFHGGTLLAVLLVFRREMASMAAEAGKLFAKKQRSGGWLLPVVIGTVPTVIIALFLKGTVKQMISSPVWVLPGMVVTALILRASDRQTREGDLIIDWKRAILVGSVQGIAVLPGISRSGATIAVGLFAGLKRETAFTFSFLLAVPATIGALILEGSPAHLPAGWLAGFAVSFLTGFLALHLLRPMVRKACLTVFSGYLLVAVGIILLLGLV